MKSSFVYPLLTTVLRIRIGDPVPICPLDPRSGAYLPPGSGVSKKSRSGSGIRIGDEHPGSYFQEPRNNFWVKILKFFDVDADPDPGSGFGMEKIRI